MQFPTGHELRDGVFYVADWWAVVFSPTFPYRLVHMVLASYLTTAFVVVGVAAYLMLRRRALEESLTMLRMGLGLIAILAPLQLVAGHEHGLSVYDTQPRQVRRHRRPLAELSGKGPADPVRLAGPGKPKEPLRDQDPRDRQLRRHRQLEWRDYRPSGIPP